MLLNRKLLAVALCIAVCVMALPRHPISVSHAQDSTITIGTTDLPLTLDPAEATTYVSWEVLSHIYTGLTRQIPSSTDYELAVAATHTVSEDGLTHTFTIRDDATFTDGTPITADTFAYSINRVITLDEEAFDLLDGIVTSVSVDENGALVFQLTRPIPYFLGLVSLPPFFAVKESDFPANNLNQFPTTLTGNGVYLFDSWNPGDSITLKANPDFQYGPVAKTDTIVLRRYISSFELSQALETRAIDLVWRDMLLPDAIETAQNNASFRLEHVPSARMWYVYMVRRFDYMDDPVVRESFLLGINRERVTQEYFQGYLTPAYSLVPALFSDAYNPLWQTTPDATLIDRKLRDAGYREANISRAQINLITSQSVYGDYYVDALNDLTKDFIPVRVIAINITTGQNLEQRGVFVAARRLSKSPHERQPAWGHMPASFARLHAAPSSARSCSAITARSRSSCGTTNEMLHSDDPCAMAMTLMPRSPITENTRPATPGVPRIPAPTAVIITTFSSTSTRSMSRRASSAASSASIASRTFRAVLSVTRKQKLCSDDDCEIIRMLAPACALARKVRPAMPGTPIIPLPLTVSRLTFLMLVTALMTVCVRSPFSRMSVPGCCGLNVFRTRIGIPLSRIGWTVLGCSTFAP
ncbi:ABC transporter substrate-binding protein [Anaerolineae bacterium CFX8]|nr:ABC transporter substrate-binding protein [Anaerolineae bacterium CFX8]